MTESSPHILVVDDHRDIRDLISKYLTKNGLRVTTADSAAAARKTMKAAAVDLVVLDIMMPGEDGLSLTRTLREQSNIPVLLVTAMAEDTDRIIGLEMGADDYLTKPFNPRELLARIKAILRRTVDRSKPRDDVSGERIAFDRFILNVGRRELETSDGAPVPLSTGEFQLLVTLIKRPHMILTRDQLLDLTAGRSAQIFDRSIDNQVSRLRKKIELDPKTPTLIKTVWGGGYTFTATPREVK